MQSGSHKQILKSDIEVAQRETKTARDAARYLNVSYTTYKKWAKQFGMFETHKNPQMKGMTKVNVEKKRERIEKVLRGEETPFTVSHKFRNVLLEYGYLEYKCYACGFDERRLSDGKSPLMCDHIDGNKNNWRLENLRMLCIRCWFMMVGNIPIRANLTKSKE